MIPYLSLISDRIEWSFQNIVENLGHHLKVIHNEKQKTIDFALQIDAALFLIITTRNVTFADYIVGESE